MNLGQCYLHCKESSTFPLILLELVFFFFFLQLNLCIEYLTLTNFGSKRLKLLHGV